VNCVVTYPLKSHRKIVTLPQENTNELAELLGIIYGDGGIGNPWQLVISLNSISDVTYSNYVVGLIETIFSTKPVMRKRPNQNTLVIVLSSTTIVDFLITKGAIRGNKGLQADSIPLWIQKDLTFSRNFVRGLVDTDGCLYLHRHRIKEKSYISIGLCFTNSSPTFLKNINIVLQNHGLKTSITDKGRRYISIAVEWLKSI
jgi:hypothetical protein